MIVIWYRAVLKIKVFWGLNSHFIHLVMVVGGKKALVRKTKLPKYYLGPGRIEVSTFNYQLRGPRFDSRFL